MYQPKQFDKQLLSYDAAVKSVLDLLNDYISCIILDTKASLLMRPTSIRALRKRQFYGRGKYAADVRSNILKYIYWSTFIEVDERIAILFDEALKYIRSQWRYKKRYGLPLYDGDLRSLFIQHVPFHFRNALKKYAEQQFERIPIELTPAKQYSLYDEMPIKTTNRQFEILYNFLNGVSSVQDMTTVLKYNAKTIRKDLACFKE